jgi:hypothetical protein
MCLSKPSHSNMVWPAAVLVSLSLIPQIRCAGAAQEQPGSRLKVTVLKGEGAVYLLPQSSPTEVVVEVKDDSDRPVQGAVVYFVLPDTGASGTFLDGTSRSDAVTTNEQGEAAVAGLRPNGVAGRWRIKVTVSHQAVTVSVEINQMNQERCKPGFRLSKTTGLCEKGGGGGKWIALVAVGGGAAAGGVVAATRGGKGGTTSGPGPTTTTRPPTTVTVGNISVGSP